MFLSSKPFHVVAKTQLTAPCEPAGQHACITYSIYIAVMYWCLVLHALYSVVLNHVLSMIVCNVFLYGRI